MLKDRFLETKGAPVLVDNCLIYQIYHVDVIHVKFVTVRFKGDYRSNKNGIVLSSNTPHSIKLSDGSLVDSVVTWDDPDLPSSARYEILNDVTILSIYPKFIIDHGDNFITQDSFIGNSGIMLVSSRPGAYEFCCSSYEEPLIKDSIKFELLIYN